MRIWRRDISLILASDRAQNTMVDHLAIEFVDLGDDYLTARMPVDQRTRQPVGIMHGGASCVLAETVGSTAANFCVDIERQYCVGLDINTNHIRSVRGGFVFGTAKPIHLGKSTQVWGIEIINEQQQLVSISRLTMAVLNRKADSM